MSGAESLVARLLGAPTQNERLLRLTTPLGAEVLLAERLDGVEAIGPSEHAPAGLRLSVHALSTSAHHDLKRLIGQTALMQLELPDATLRPWHGHITQAALEGSDGGLARYRLVIEPWLAFLGHRQDSWVFQDMTVMQIVEAVFADWRGQGKLAPAWRWALADPGVYPRRSLCIQYRESDLAFVQRLLREEGLFCWFEHQAAPDDAALGSHTLVIADHNGTFATNAQPFVRYTQSGASFAEDSLVRWQRKAHVQAASLAMASPDYRCGPQHASLRPVSAAGSKAPLSALAVTDVPGQYAYEDSAQGERLARRQMQALDAMREQAQGKGTWRSAAPGTTFTLIDHPVHDGSDAARDRFAILAVRHRARNNLKADVKAGLQSLADAIGLDTAGHVANQPEEPLYEAILTAQRAAVPVRIAAWHDGVPDPRLHPRPTIDGVQSALVVGLGAPIHTDRDHRIKIQFHWQRGSHSSHRLDPAAGDNAPASDASGTWVRVAESAAGANWGSNFTPRIGQEVLVGFVGGDIDRPVVLGALYNGQGQPDGQGNQSGQGAAGATGNAPAWFPGGKAQGKHQGHQHPAVLAGYKSQEMAASGHGAGGFNQFVMDDSAGQGRIELSSTGAQTRLQLGHLLQQIDNRRLGSRGHGLDLATQAWGAIRAGSGLLISAHGKAASTSTAQQMDALEPQRRLEQAQQLVEALADSARAQHAGLDSDAQRPVQRALEASGKSLSATARTGDGQGAAGGGSGTVATLGRPDFVIAAPAGIAAHTPADTIASAGNSAAFVAGQDLQQLAQADSVTAVKDGMVFYTYGKAQNANKPNTETGIQLHAATGNVNTQSQTGATRLTADRAVSVASTAGMVKITAPEHILLTAGGAAIRIEGGNITLSGPGKVEFKASMKELGPPKSASQELELHRPGRIFDEQFVVKDQTSGQPLPYFKYRIEDAEGQLLARGITGPDGKTLRVFTEGAKGVRILADD